jgi:serine/threonine-protein kinase
LIGEGAGDHVSEQNLPTVQVGDVLAGKYRVERVLGVGGMGIVVAARHIDLHELRAIKLMLSDFALHPEAVERFLREARAAARLKSEHVAKVHDVGRLETGAPYMVMEHLEGCDLQQLLRSQGPLQLEIAVTYVLQACEALAEAHAAGIVHRDIKPANLFLARSADGTPTTKVLDFGISKFTPPAGSAPGLDMTKTTEALGSPLYMSPEQMASTRNVDLRTDIWALGVVLYQLVTGVVPFRAESLTQLCAMVFQQEPLPPSHSRNGLPVEFDRVVLRCLQKAPGQRYANVAELAVDLLPFGADGARTSVDRIKRMLGIPSLQASAPSSPSLAIAAQTANPSFASHGTAAQSDPLGAGTSATWGKTASGKKKASPIVGIIFAGAVGTIVLVAGIALLLHRGPTPSGLSTPDSPAVQLPSPASTSPGAVGSPAPIDVPPSSSSDPAPSSNLPSPSASAGKAAGPPVSTKTSPGAQKVSGSLAPHPPQKPAAARVNPFGDDRN